MVQGRDYLIAGIGGAVEGFFDNQSRENAEAKVRKEQDRQLDLLLQKEKRLRGYQKEDAALKRSQDLFDKGEEREYQKENEQLKRSQTLFDKADEREYQDRVRDDTFENTKTLEEMRNDRYLGVAGLKTDTKETERTKRAQDFLRKEFMKAEAARKKDAFGDPDSKPLDFESWAEENYPEKLADGFPNGLTAAPQTLASSGGSKFSGIYNTAISRMEAINKGAASRTKQGANDSVEEPAPITVAPGGRVMTDTTPSYRKTNPVNELPSLGQTPSTVGDTLQSLPPAPSADATAAVEKAVTSNPKSVDIGQVLGLFAKGAVNVGGMSLEALKGLKWALENTGDVSRSMTEPYKQLSAEVGQAMVDAGENVYDTMTAPTTYEQKVSGLNQSKVRYGGGNL